MAKEIARTKELQRWLECFSAYDREFMKWSKRVRNILRRYRDEERDTRREGNARFNILWSNVQTLKAATFSRMPKPDVSRRFRDNDPVGRVAAMILERALDYEIQKYTDYIAAMNADVQDRFLGGRGSAWVRYEPHFRAVKSDLPTDGDQVTEDIDEPQEELDYECAPVDYVHWDDFGHTVARTWEEVTAVWRRVYMTREALIERFGKEQGEKIPLDASPDKSYKQYADQQRNYAKRACIIEVWDKTKKEALWISKSMNDVLDRKADPLGLEEFFPCPRPLYATLTNDQLVPVPDFTLYQDQALQLDILDERIRGLIEALKVAGAYDASTPALARVFTEGTNNTLIPVNNWAAFAEKNGLKGAVDLFDVTPIAATLRESYLAFEQIKNQVYEITGISDIIRGQSKATETATAQQLKGNYASLRLKQYQDEVARFATEIIQIKAQVICGKFAPQTIARIAAVDQLSPQDQHLVPQAMALLVGEDRMMNPEADTGPNPLRDFRVEIAADTLVYIDEEAEKQSRVEFLTATGAFLEKAAQVASVAPQMTPLLLDMLKFGVTGFKAGRQLEGQIDAFIDQTREQMAQPKPPPPPDPKLEAEKIRAQAEIAQTQGEMQMLPMRQQIEQTKVQSDAIKARAEMVKAQAGVQQAMIQASTPKGMPQ